MCHLEFVKCITMKRGRMTSLIENIVSLEKRAAEIVADAQDQAKAIELRADEEIAQATDRLIKETDSRIEAHRAESVRRQEAELATVEAEAVAASSAIARITPAVISKYAERVVARLLQG